MTLKSLNLKILMQMNRYSDTVKLITLRLEQIMSYDKCGYDTLLEAEKYSVTAGGKHLRGLILLETAKYGGITADNAVDFACAVEMVHTYSLIHDDLPEMDDDDLRRGMPTCHKKFGTAIALLAGDGEENLRHAVADVVLYYVAHEKPRQENADDGIDEIEGVGVGDIETVGEHVLDLCDEPFEEKPGKGGQDADNETDGQDELLFAEVHPPPDEEAFKEGEFPFCRVHVRLISL